MSRCCPWACKMHKPGPSFVSASGWCQQKYVQTQDVIHWAFRNIFPFCFMFCLTFLQFQASPGKVCGEISHPKSWCRAAKWHKGLQITSSWSVVKRELYVCNISLSLSLERYQILSHMCVILYLCIVKELRQRHSGFVIFVTECSHAKCTITYSKVHIYIYI